MLRIIVQTKRKYKSKNKKRSGGWNSRRDEKVRGRRKKCETDKETEEGSDHNSDKDQDSDVSFQEDVDEAIDTTAKRRRLEYQSSRRTHEENEDILLDWNTQKTEMANGE